MHPGATLRLLRVDAGLSLRDLARRIGVSSAYLSRVEHGLDAVPTPERLAAIARELDVPPTLLMDVAHRVSPFVASYMEQVPGAGTLFLDIARRKLTSAQLTRVRAFLAEEFPLRSGSQDDPVPALAPLLTRGRIVLKLSCTTLEDARDVAAGRLADACTEVGVARLIDALAQRQDEASCAVGNGVAVPHATVEGVPPLAALVTLAKPLRCETPDGQPLRLIIAVVGNDRGRERLMRLAQVARLASQGLAARLQDAQHAPEVLTHLAELEALR
jgi:PTS system nitrogen regulatory IIA component